MQEFTFASDAVLAVFAAVGLVATFAAIVADTRTRRRALGGAA